MDRIRLLIVAILVSVCSSVTQTPAQTTSVSAAKDANAASLLSSALNAMSPVLVNDITITGQAVGDASTDSESGTLTFKALNGGDASLAFSLASGQRNEIVNPTSDPQAAWSGIDGVWHKTALHNTWTPAAWFAPALVLESALTDPQLALQNLGSTSLNGRAVQHIRFWRVLSSASGASATIALVQGLSTVDIYLDAASNLPIVLGFNLHSDLNAGTNIPVAVFYSNWQKSSGVLVPMHLQKFLNGNLLDDIAVTSATVNSGLTSSSFSVPAVSGDAQ
jgi:hypothetical protein